MYGRVQDVSFVITQSAKPAHIEADFHSVFKVFLLFVRCADLAELGNIDLSVTTGLVSVR